MRELKWYIVDENNHPLCYESDGCKSIRAIEFDTEEEAKEFMKMIFLNYPDFRMDEVRIVEAILYYDGGYVSGARAMELMKEE